MLAQGREGLSPVHGHGLGKTVYERHQPEQRLLCQLVEAHYPALIGQLAQHDCMDAGGRATQGAVAEGKSLPANVHREFEAYLKCGRLEYGFLQVRCDKYHFERLVVFSCKRRGICRGTPRPKRWERCWVSFTALFRPI